MVEILSDSILCRHRPLLVLSALCEDLSCEHAVNCALNAFSILALGHAFGYHTFALREQNLVCSVSGSMGSVLANVEYTSTSLGVPKSLLIQTTAGVFDFAPSGSCWTFHHALDEGSLSVTSFR